LGNSEYCIVEADEFDRSFLHLTPHIAVVNSIDADHLDIYGSNEYVRESYLAFMNKAKEGSYLLISEQVAIDLGQADIDMLKSKYKLLTFGFKDDNDILMNNLSIVNGRVVFDYFSPFGSIEKIALRMPGYHNVSNASVAISVALILGKIKEEIATAIANFKGVKRRFEWIVENEKIYIDDYAHHPTELKMAIGAVRMMYPGKKVLGIFQPHLYTRTRDFLDGFAEELSKLDEVVLMEIYPARELPIEGVNSSTVLEKINNNSKSLMSEGQILNKIKQKDFDVVLTLGAGNIDLLIPKIKDILS
jgi:UDP-N-acetylmuramate--alanine ligase